MMNSSERDKDKFASLAEGFDTLGKKADGTVDEKRETQKRIMGRILRTSNYERW